MLPKISIIIPVYNVEEYIAECLQSVMNQSYGGDMECIIVDDCSEDRSIAVASQMIEEYKGEITFLILHHKCNRGLSAARNTGTSVADGDYIYYLDSDDFIDSNTIEELSSSTLNNNYAIVIGNAVSYRNGKDEVFKPKWIFSEARDINPDQFLTQMLMQKSIFIACGKLFKKEVVQKVKFREGCINEDTLFIIDVAPIIEGERYVCRELPLYTYHYRIRPGSICQQSIHRIAMAYVENIGVAIEKYYNRVELVNWLKFHRLKRCVKSLQCRDIDKLSYTIGAKCLQDSSNKNIRVVSNFRVFIKMMLIKYFPRIMWFFL